MQITVGHLAAATLIFAGIIGGAAYFSHSDVAAIRADLTSLSSEFHAADKDSIIRLSDAASRLSDRIDAMNTKLTVTDTKLDDLNAQFLPPKR